MTIANSDREFGVLLFATQSGITLIKIAGVNSAVVSGNTVTMTRNSGVYEFDMQNTYMHSIVIAGGAIANDGVFAYHG